MGVSGQLGGKVKSVSTGWLVPAPVQTEFEARHRPPLKLLAAAVCREWQWRGNTEGEDWASAPSFFTGYGLNLQLVHPLRLNSKKTDARAHGNALHKTKPARRSKRQRPAEAEAEEPPQTPAQRTLQWFTFKASRLHVKVLASSRHGA